jgi:hypothetical protein
MALLDPQVIPGTPELSLARISAALGNFGSDDSTYELTVQHSRNSRARHVVKLTQRKISADPLLPTQNREYTQSIHIVIDHPKQGFVNTEVNDLATRAIGYFGTAGLMADIIQGQA